MPKSRVHLKWELNLEQSKALISMGKKVGIAKARTLAQLGTESWISWEQYLGTAGSKTS